MVAKKKSRKAQTSRRTKETDFTVSLNLDGCGSAQVNTGLEFFDHMLRQIARHGLVDLNVQGKGDLNVDGHHTVEDVGIVLGQTFAKALGERVGITRYSNVRLPMMDALALVALDAGGRGNLVFLGSFPETQIGAFDTALVREFFWSLATQAGIDLHIEIAYGENSHHMTEAVFKGFGRALRAAAAIDSRETGVPSTKGVL